MYHNDDGNMFVGNNSHADNSGHIYINSEFVASHTMTNSLATPLL
jgi:hypothetical protein